MPFLPTSSSINRVASNDPDKFYSPEPERHIKDIIYDLIPVSPYLTRFIDTKPFQRLRNVKQLGTTCYVWPSASHSRFEHCLGVAYLARCLASHLQRSQPELNITDRDVACVEIAGLCHDLGHGPWSHVWDGIFMKKAIASEWKHEQGSNMMFDYIIEKYSIPMSEKDVKFVKALIDGDHKKASPDEKKCLFHIVANKANGIDVDKLDYIQRDSRMLGESISISLPRILKSARVINDEITYNIKDADSIYNICCARFRLHKAFYNHKSAKAIEYMIVDALRSAEPHLKIAERVFDPEKFLHLSDVIMNTIEESTAPELEEARHIFTRIRERDLYRCVDYKVVDWELRKAFETLITPERIVAATRSITPTALNPPSPEDDGDVEIEQIDARTFDDMREYQESPEVLQPDDIIIDFATMHHGMGAANPLDSVKFYSKNHPNVAMQAGPGVYSGLLPRIFAEVMLRIFTKKPKFYGLVQAGFRALLAEMSDVETDAETEPTLDTDASFTTAAPLTPGAKSQTLPVSPGDTAVPAEKKKRVFGRTTSASFAANPFTGVPHDFAPPSPSTRNKPVTRRQSEGRFSAGISPLAPSPLIKTNAPALPTDPLASPGSAAKTLKRPRGLDNGNTEVKDKKRRAS